MEIRPSQTAAILLSITPHLLYMALVSGFAGVLFWNLGTKILTPLNSMLFMDVVPITTFVVSSIAGVVPTRMQLVGASMTGLALILNNIFLRRRNMATVRPATLPGAGLEARS